MASLSVRDVAERARTSDRTVRRWIAEGKLPATRQADGWTVDESDLSAYLDGRTAAADRVDGRTDGRPPSEARLLAQLLSDTQRELVRVAAAAAMWQARAELLQGQLDHALDAPAPSRIASGSSTDGRANEPTQNTSEVPKRRWWWPWHGQAV